MIILVQEENLYTFLLAICGKELTKWGEATKLLMDDLPGGETMRDQGRETCTTFIKGILYHISLDDLHHDPTQPRKYFDVDSLKELEDSIKSHGVIEPILFSVDFDGKLVIVAGARRCIAAKNAGLQQVPGIFTDGNLAEISIVENLLREDLTAVEEAEALDALVKKHDYTHEQLAKTLGKGRSTISEMLSLVKLPQTMRDECRKDPRCSRRVLVEIAKEQDEKSMWRLYAQVKRRSLNGDAVRRISRPGNCNSVHSILKLVKALHARIGVLDASEVNPNESERLKTEIEKLGQAIYSKLQRADFGAPT